MTIRAVKKLLFLLALSSLFVSCGEEVLTQSTLSNSEQYEDVKTYNLNSCAAMRFVKPPVDILFVVDNSGSTLQSSFTQIKNEIANTVSTISNEFDYHVYIAPLHPGSSDNISGYPLVVSDVNTLGTQALNIIKLEDINAQTFFADATGGNTESGFKRVHEVIEANRSNKIFRKNANTIAVMISNGDDTEVMSASGNNIAFDSEKFKARKSAFETLASGLEADSFRFISLVPHSNCNGWRTYGHYKKMSQEVHDSAWSKISAEGKDAGKDSRDLCSGNYAELFSVVNESIRQQIQGHKYDWWKISSANSEAAIAADDITVKKVKEGGQTEVIPRSSTNGYTYEGYKTGQNTRYEPDVGEPATGLMIRLHGEARLSYPDCIIAKTRTPTEYFGYAVIPREPQLGTVKVEVNGAEVPNGGPNGWSYEGYHEYKNVKVPGPEKVSVTPELKKTGYFIKLNGSSIVTNGDSVNVYYKPKAI